jgi:Ca2+-binding RTX toxin-like protein
MRNSSRGATSVALGGVTLIGVLLSSLSAPALAAGPSAAGTPASVTSTPATGVRIVGSTGNDQMVLTRAGTATAPLIHIDAAAPLTILAGCQPVAGDATRALCTAPFASGTTLRVVTVVAGTGDDVIAHGASLPIPLNVTGGSGRDTINGGPGQDSLHGGPDNDTVRGGDNTDTLTGGSNDDTLDGGPGSDDDLSGGSGADQLFGGDGDSDDLDGGAGPDTFDGGAGRNDIVEYDTRSNGVQAQIGSTSALNGEINEGDLFKTGIENVVGGDGNDVLVGDAGDNNLLGGGDDLIFGGRGQDAVIGGEGDDFLGGNALNIGGPGDVPNADGVRDFIGGQDGTDSCVRSAADLDSVTECETVTTDG